MCGLVLLTRGRREEKIRFVFGLHADVDAAAISRPELEALESALLTADLSLLANSSSASSDAQRRRAEILADLFGAKSSGNGASEAVSLDSGAEGKVGFEAFRLWLLTEEEESDGAEDRLLSLQQRHLPKQQQQQRAFLPRNSERLCVTRWLLHDHAHMTLSNDEVTPTFYQTLAGVTHLEESDIIELEKRYWMLKTGSKTGR